MLLQARGAPRAVWSTSSEWKSMKKRALLWKRPKLNKSASPRYLVLFKLNMAKFMGWGGGGGKEYIWVFAQEDSRHWSTYVEIACWRAGVIFLYLATTQILPRPGFVVYLYAMSLLFLVRLILFAAQNFFSRLSSREVASRWENHIGKIIFQYPKQ